jgi:regulator of replication initiation timing
MNKEGIEMVADLLLLIQGLQKQVETLKNEMNAVLDRNRKLHIDTRALQEHIDKIKEPNGLELAMREEWFKYENVLREN